MTAAASLGQRHNDRADQLKQLRLQMAAVAGKVGAGRRPPDAVPASENVLPVPPLLAGVLPAGCRGARWRWPQGPAHWC